MCKNSFLSIILFLFLGHLGYASSKSIGLNNPKDAVCAINIVDITNVFCSNGDITTLTFDLDVVDPGPSGQFIVTDIFGNTSTHNYANLPVTVELVSPIDESVVFFTVCDINNTNCCDTEDFENPCFNPCWIDIDVIQPSCDAGSVVVLLDFEHNTGTSTSFVVTDHFGNTSTHNYADLPITFAMNGSVQGLTNLNFTVCDAINTECCNSGEIENPCPWCDFGSLNVTATCQPNSAWFDAVVDFDADVYLSNSFSLKINGILYGTFPYSALPITIPNLEGDCTTTRVFEVEDMATGDCSSLFTLGPICCTTCEISNITLQNISCNSNNTVLALLNMDYQGNGNGNFTVTDIFGNTFTYPYANLPLMLELSGPSDLTNIGLNICDQEFQNCCAFIEFANPCYNDQPNCNLIIFDVQNVSCSEDTASLFFNLIYSGEGDSGFIVTDSYGNTSLYSYDDLPLNLFIPTNTDDESIAFWVCDVDNANCCATYELANPCFDTIPCNIAISDVQNIICSNGDIASLVFDLNYDGEGDNGFNVSDDYGNVSTYNYANLPLQITVTAPTYDSIIGFQVCDVDNPNCCAYYQFYNPCYSSTPNCFIGIVGGYTECTDSFNFDYHFNLNAQAVSDSFLVKVNDSLYGIFAYNTLPISISGLLGDCVTSYEIFVQDQVNANCFNTATILPICCAEPLCSIEVSSIQDVICDGQDTMLFILDLNYENTDSIGFTLYDYLGNLTTYTYDQLPIIIVMEATPDVDSVSFVICDIGNDNCCTTYNMANPCYVEPPCDIEIFDLQSIVCSNGDIASVTFNVDYIGEGNSGFIITDDYGNNSTHAYADLPLTLNITAPTNDELIGFQVCDVDFPNCCDYIEFENPCFVPPSGNRVIRADIDIQQILNTFNIELDVEHTLEPNCTFSILVNDEVKGSMANTDTLALIGPFECTSADSFKLEILSNCLHEVVWERMLHQSDIECISGSQDDVTNQPKVHYNIVDNILTLQCQSLQKCNFGLYDLQGRLVMQSLVQAERNIHLTGLSLGMYIVVLRDENSQTTVTQKIVIVRE